MINTLNTTNSTSWKNITPEGETNFTAFELPSGMRAVVYFDDNPVSYAGFIIGAGSSSDPHRFHGLAHFVEHMLFKGTPKRNARQIINRMEEVGADFNAYTTKEETFVYTAFSQEYFVRVLDIMTDVVRNSMAPQHELEKEKGVIIEEINSYKDSPAELIFDDYENLLFHGEALGHNILGSESSVARISSRAVQQFIAKHYTPQNMLFCYRGKNIDTSLLLHYLNFHFPPNQSDNTVESYPHWSSTIIAPSPIRKQVNRHFSTFQVHRIIGCHSYSLQEPKRIGLTLLNNLFGGRGMNSRLNINLREDKGLVYSVESNFYPFKQAGFLSVYFGTTKNKLADATQAVFEEMDKLKQNPICPDELRKAKRQFMGQLIVQDDNRENAFLEMGKSFFYFNRYDKIETIRKRIENIDEIQLQHIAQSLFVPEKTLQLTYY